MTAVSCRAWCPAGRKAEHSGTAGAPRMPRCGPTWPREFLVVLRRVLLVERADRDVEARGDAARFHQRHGERHVAGRLRGLPLGRVHIAVQDLLGRVERVAPADHRDLAGLDAGLVEDALDAARDEVAEPDDGLDLALVGGQVVDHPGDDLGLVERGVGDLPGDAKGLEDARDALLLLHAIGGARHLDRHPDEVALLHELLVDQVLRPALAEGDIVAAHIGIEVGGGIGRVEVDDRDLGRVRLLDDLDQAARIGAAGHDAVGLGGDRRRAPPPAAPARRRYGTTC